MALPKIKHPIYAITIPSTQQQVNIRPFTVQEEKILLMARSSENSDDIVNSLKQIIKNCVVEKIDVDKLSTFDVEYLFIKLRAKSVGEVVDLEYSIPNSDPQEIIKFKINLDEVEIKNNINHKKKFTLHEDIGVSMRYPTINEIRSIDNMGTSDQSVLDVLIKCIDQIYDDDRVYDDFTNEELINFVNSLPLESMKNIRDFFETMPVVEHSITLKSKEGKDVEVTLRGLNNFFT